MHAGARPDADRRLSCPGSYIPAGKQSEDISTVIHPHKGLPYLADRKFFGKAPPLALILRLAKNPKIQQKAARQNFQTLPAPFERKCFQRAPTGMPSARCKRSSRLFNKSRLRRIK